MNEYTFKYYKNKYIIFILFPLWIIPLIVITTFLVNNECLINLMEKNIIISIAIYISVICGLLYLILDYGMKLLAKNIEIQLNNNNMKIDNEIVDYKDIKTVKFETIKSSVGNIITGYLLKIKYGNYKKNIVIFTGLSKKEKHNCETFMKFYYSFNNVYQSKREDN